MILETCIRMKETSFQSTYYSHARKYHIIFNSPGSSGQLWTKWTCPKTKSLSLFSIFRAPSIWIDCWAIRSFELKLVLEVWNHEISFEFGKQEVWCWAEIEVVATQFCRIFDSFCSNPWFFKWRKIRNSTELQVLKFPQARRVKRLNRECWALVIEPENLQNLKLRKYTTAVVNCKFGYYQSFFFFF